MLGAIIGDIVGSPYEFDRGKKTTEFTLFNSECDFTDDTVMTCAIAQAVLRANGNPTHAHDLLTQEMRAWFHRYPNPKGSYGGRFLQWLCSEEPRPYNSWGNGSAMRVSAVGWLFPTAQETLLWAGLTADVTHNHPEGVKGAQAVALAIFRARHWEKSQHGVAVGKAELKAEITEKFGYDLSRTVDEIRPGYFHKESCQESVPEALTCFLESTDFENALRLGVSIGGDTDTIGAIIGGIAEAAYGIPRDIARAGMEYLPQDVKAVLQRFWESANKPMVSAIETDSAR